MTLRQARDLPVWGFPGQSNPYCRLVLGEQAVQSRREGDTSHPGRHRHPIWNQEFQFLVEDPDVQVRVYVHAVRSWLTCSCRCTRTGHLPTPPPPYRVTPPG